MSFRRNLPRAIAVLIVAMLSAPFERIAICSVEMAAAAESDDCCGGTHKGASCPMKKRASHSPPPADDSAPRFGCCRHIPFDALIEGSAPLQIVELGPPHMLWAPTAVLSPTLPDGPYFPIFLPPRV
jgi:hypothetical protein